MIVIDMDMPLSCYDCKLQDACGLAIINHHRRDKRDKFCPIKCDIEDIRAEIRNIAQKAADKVGYGCCVFSVDEIERIIDKLIGAEMESSE